MKYFLTGAPGVGKTTAVMKVAEILRGHGLTVGGMITKEIRQRGRRIGFKVIDLMSGKSGHLAVAYEPGQPRVGKYHVRLSEFEAVGVNALLKAMELSDIIICDEVGPMELYSNAFIEAVKILLGSSKPVVGTVHYRARHPLVIEIKRRCRIFVVTLENRSRLPMLIAEEIIKNLERR